MLYSDAASSNPRKYAITGALAQSASPAYQLTTSPSSVEDRRCRAHRARPDRRLLKVAEQAALGVQGHLETVAPALLSRPKAGRSARSVRSSEAATTRRPLRARVASSSASSVGNSATHGAAPGRPEVQHRDWRAIQGHGLSRSRSSRTPQSAPATGRSSTSKPVKSRCWLRPRLTLRAGPAGAGSRGPIADRPARRDSQLLSIVPDTICSKLHPLSGCSQPGAPEYAEI